MQELIHRAHAFGYEALPAVTCLSTAEIAGQREQLQELTWDKGDPIAVLGEYSASAWNLIDP